ncbi:MAG: hypothetical protein ACLUIQ_00640 [Dialister invisus]
MFTSKYRWMAAFGTSIACHVVVFVVIGVVVALFPSAPVDKGPIEVEWFHCPVVAVAAAEALMQIMTCHRVTFGQTDRSCTASGSGRRYAGRCHE